MNRVPKKRLNRSFRFVVGSRNYVGVVHPRTRDFFIKNYSDDCHVVPFPLWLEGHCAYEAVVKENPVIREGCRLAKEVLKKIYEHDRGSEKIRNRTREIEMQIAK